MACGNNKVSRTGLLTQPVALSQPSTVPSAGPIRQQAVAAAREADARVDRADTAIEAATSSAAVKTAVRDAQRALDSARRAGGDRAARVKLRALEHKVEQIRVKAAGKEATIDREGRTRRSIIDPLSRMSLGVVAHRLPPPPPPPKDPQSDAVKSMQKDLRTARAQARQAKDEQALDRILAESEQKLSSVGKSALAPNQSQSLDSLKEALRRQAESRREQIRESNARGALPQQIESDLSVKNIEHITIDDKMDPHSLLPSTAYVFNDNVYVTDASGRIAGGTVVITPVRATRHAEAQADFRGAAREFETDESGTLHAGHLHAVSLGGHPSGPNLFEQNQNFNQSAFRGLEKTLEKLALDGHSVRMQFRLAEPIDANGMVAPSALIVTTYVDDEPPEEVTFINEGHQFK